MRKASESKVFKPPRIEITGVLKREQKEEKITAENFPDLVKNIHLNSRCSTNSTLDKHRDTPAHHSQTVGNREYLERSKKKQLKGSIQVTGNFSLVTLETRRH